MANLLESNPNISIKRSHLNLFENIPGNEDNSNSSQVKHTKHTKCVLPTCQVFSVFLLLMSPLSLQLLRKRILKEEEEL